jgi:hypothetical protein|tara:strand:+ start:21468 stop:21713 length:246 start_codon:yes stop_codon:yes gene_type:complete
MTIADDRYGVLFNDEEMDLLLRSVQSMIENVENITGQEPKDLMRLHGDLILIKQKGYINIKGNTVTEEELIEKGYTCEECE